MVAAVLLAAGAGSRFHGDGHKLRAELDGRAVLSHSLDAVLASGLEVIVVTGAVDVDDLIPATVAAVRNPAWESGQAASVRVGIEAAAARGHEAVVVGLGDQPMVLPEAWTLVAASRGPIGVATYGGVRGNPVLLAQEVWPLLPTSGDAVGRDVMRSRPELVREIPCPGDPTDIDTLEDLRRWT